MRGVNWYPAHWSQLSPLHEQVGNRAAKSGLSVSVVGRPYLDGVVTALGDFDSGVVGDGCEGVGDPTHRFDDIADHGGTSRGSQPFSKIDPPPRSRSAWSSAGHPRNGPCSSSAARRGSLPASCDVNRRQQEAVTVAAVLA